MAEPVVDTSWLDSLKVDTTPPTKPELSLGARDESDIVDTSWLDALRPKKEKSGATAADALQAAQNDFPETAGYGVELPRKLAVQPPAVAAMEARGGLPTQAMPVEAPPTAGSIAMDTLQGMGHSTANLGDAASEDLNRSVAGMVGAVKSVTPELGGLADEAARPFLESADRARVNQELRTEGGFRPTLPERVVTGVARAAAGMAPLIAVPQEAMPTAMGVMGMHSGQERAKAEGADEQTQALAGMSQGLIDSTLGAIFPHKIQEVLSKEIAAGTPLGQRALEGLKTVASGFASMLAQSEGDEAAFKALTDSKAETDHVALAQNAIYAAIAGGLTHLIPDAKTQIETLAGEKPTAHPEDQYVETGEANHDTQEPAAQEANAAQAEVPPVPGGQPESGPVAEITPRGPEAGGVPDVRTEGIAEAIARGEMPERRSQEPPPPEAPRRRVSEMSLEEAQKALLTDPVTGLGNHRAWEESKAADTQGPIKLILDVDAFKGMNKALGYEGADNALKVFGDAARRLGVADSFTRGSSSGGGDEFRAHFSDKSTAEDVANAMRSEIQDAVFPVKMPDGTIHEYTGVDFSHGIGDSEETANEDLNRNKALRTAAGLRPADREAPPPGLRRTEDSVDGRPEPRGSTVAAETAGPTEGVGAVPDLLPETPTENTESTKAAVEEPPPSQAESTPVSTSAVDGRMEGEAVDAMPNMSLGKEGIQPRTKALPVENQEPYGTNDVIRELSKEFKVPIRSKLFRQKALGIYKRMADVVRTKGEGDIATVAHEVAHKIWSTGAMRDVGRAPVAAKKELYDIGFELYKGHKKPAGGYYSEGFSEYMRHRWSRDDASTVAPEFDKYWNGVLSRPDRAKLAASDQVAKNAYDRWRQPGPEGALARVKGQLNIDNRIVKANQKPFAERFDDRLRKAEASVLSDRAPLAWATRQVLKVRNQHWNDLPADQNPDTVKEITGGVAASVARDAAMHGWTNQSGDTTSPSLAEAFKPYTMDQYADVAAYLVSKRTLEDTSKPTGIELADAKAVVDRLETPQLLKTAEQVRKWNNGLVDYLTESGVITRELGERIKGTDLFYVPLKRIFTDSFEQTGEGAGRGTGMPKRRHGSELPIEDPMVAMALNAEAAIRLADQTRVKRALTNLVTKTPNMGWLVEKVELPAEQSKILAARVEKGITQMFGEADMDTRRIAEIFRDNKDTMLDLFGPATKYRGNKPVVVLANKQGTYDAFEIGDPLVYRAIESDPTGGKAAGMLAKAANKIAAGVRLGATGANPGFSLVTNFLRDVPTAFLQAKQSVAMLRNIPRVIEARPVRRLIGEQDPMAKESNRLFRAGGVELSGPLGVDRRVIDTMRDEMMSKSFKDFLKLTMRHPVEIWRELLSKAEAVPRRAEMLAVYERALARGDSKMDAYYQARSAGARVTLNFRDMGSGIRDWNRMDAFLSVALNGPRSMLRLMMTDPQTGDLVVSRIPKHEVRGTNILDRYEFKPQNLAFKRILLTGGLTMTLPAILQWARHKDERWYQELPNYEKLMYMHLKIGDEIVRLPLPQEWGTALGTYPVALLDSWLHRDRDKAEQATLDWIDALGPNLLPSAVQPIFNVARNKNAFGSKIESDRMRELLADDRFYESTSEVYRAVSKALNKALPDSMEVSAPQVQQVAEGYTGGGARGLFDVVKKKRELADYPVVGRLFLRKARAGKSVDDLYRLLDRADQTYNSINAARKAGNQERVDYLEKRNKDLLGIDDRFMHGQARHRYSNLFRMRDATEKIKDIVLGAHKKGEDIDTEAITTIARRALGRELDPSQESN